MSAELFDIEVERRARRSRTRSRQEVTASSAAMFAATDAMFVGCVRLGVAFMGFAYACATEPWRRG